MALLLSEHDVHAVLTMPDAVARIEAAMKALGLQDVAMAGHVYQKAMDAGLGQQVPLFEP
jgi:ornithine cyclodeaminase/alanine dehydrogenase-like protein (mu-crystallin family)